MNIFPKAARAVMLRISRSEPPVVKNRRSTHPKLRQASRSRTTIRMKIASDQLKRVERRVILP